MRLQSLTIENFRALTKVKLDELSDVVVLAGPNGCGKSTVLDAIRLVKTVYGGYQENEWQLWLNEFQINLNRGSEDIAKLLQNKERPAVISVVVRLSEEETRWLRESASDLTRDAAWREIMGGEDLSPRLGGMAARLRSHEKEIEKKVRANSETLLSELQNRDHKAEVVLTTDGRVGRVAPSLVLETVFSLYAPKHIGIIDYHGAQRTYAREQVGGINLNIASTEQQLRQHALYNYQNKYSNIKTELAAAYIREMIAARAGVQASDQENLLETLKELFTTFFPGKHFLGAEPTPSGSIVFNVRTSTGALHDINELSSGEKEVLYGYLRLRNSAPRNSVLMIDEPELHLNPRLIDGLPDFYHRHLGLALGNQLWLVTHSDAILRQAVGRDAFKVYHMQLPEAFDSDINQAKEITVSEELERAIVDLVGDLAAYRPGAKTVIVEGGGEAEFDMRVIRDLFPEFASRVNLLSGGNKRRVRDLHALLEDARRKAILVGTFYSIADRDFEDEQPPLPGRVLTWDRFHIENYLLEPKYILQVMRDLAVPSSSDASEANVDTWLQQCAEQTLPDLLRHYLEQYANSVLVQEIRTRVEPAARDIPAAIQEAVAASYTRLTEVVRSTVDLPSLQRIEQDRRDTLKQALENGEWKAIYRGRDILKRFAGTRLAGKVNYSAFRDLIVSRMRDDMYKPEGMQRVLDLIHSTSSPA